MGQELGRQETRCEAPGRGWAARGRSQTEPGGGRGAGQGAGPGQPAACSPGRLRGPGRDLVTGLLHAPPPKPAPWGRDSRPSVPCSAAVSASRQSSRGFVLFLITKTELWYGKTEQERGNSSTPFRTFLGRVLLGCIMERKPQEPRREVPHSCSLGTLSEALTKIACRRQSDVCNSKTCELFFRYM